MTSKYKYRTEPYADGDTLVMRTFRTNSWPKDQLDMETLVVEGDNRKVALKAAKQVADYHWG